MRVLLAIGVLVLGSLFAVSARAYSDPARFTDEPLFGGGGGRFFTGSPVDGYSCSVCHTGGITPQVTIAGLPIGGYEPGATYRVELRFRDPGAPHAAHLELVDLNGLGTGSVTLPPPEQIGPEGRCEQAPDGEVAAFITEFSRGRRIVGLMNCGASSLRFNFTAPPDHAFAFAGAVLRSDDSITPQGDGVLELTKVLHRRGVEGPVRGTTACAIVTAPRPEGRSSLPWLGAFMCAAFFCRRVMRWRVLCSVLQLH